MVMLGGRPLLWRVGFDFLLGTRSPWDRAVGPEGFLLEGTIGECEKTEGECNVRTISTSDSTSEPDAVVKSHMTSA